MSEHPAPPTGSVLSDSLPAALSLSRTSTAAEQPLLHSGPSFPAEEAARGREPCCRCALGWGFLLLGELFRRCGVLVARHLRRCVCFYASARRNNGSRLSCARCAPHPAGTPISGACSTIGSHLSRLKWTGAVEMPCKYDETLGETDTAAQQ